MELLKRGKFPAERATRAPVRVAREAHGAAVSVKRNLGRGGKRSRVGRDSLAVRRSSYAGVAIAPPAGA
jgi:hypothetical protein